MLVLPEVLRVIFLLLHIIFAVIGVGAVSVTDYLHLIGLRSKRLEKRLVFVYPLLSRMIVVALAGMVITGIVLLANKPELLSSALFQLKMGLFCVIVVNGIILHAHVAPVLTKCIEKGKRYCSKDVLFVSAISGTISIVTWYSILILSLTKSYKYSVQDFIFFYICILVFVFLITLYAEKKAHSWKS